MTLDRPTLVAIKWPPTPARVNEAIKAEKAAQAEVESAREALANADLGQRWNRAQMRLDVAKRDWREKERASNRISKCMPWRRACPHAAPACHDCRPDRVVVDLREQYWAAARGLRPYNLAQAEQARATREHILAVWAAVSAGDSADGLVAESEERIRRLADGRWANHDRPPTNVSDEDRQAFAEWMADDEHCIDPADFDLRGSQIWSRHLTAGPQQSIVRIRRLRQPLQYLVTTDSLDAGDVHVHSESLYDSLDQAAAAAEQICRERSGAD